MGIQSSKLEHWFWGRVSIRGPDECWEWQAAKTTFGYGNLFDPELGKNITAHRKSYEMHNGPIPPRHQVMHTCDNPPCCNPAHLVLGTSRDNMLDKEAKGRGNHAVGEANHSVLTRQQVVEMRWLRATTGVHYSELGRMYGVSQVTARLICIGKKWKHVRMVRSSHG